MLFVRLHTGIHKNKYVSDKNVRKDTHNNECFPGSREELNACQKMAQKRGAFRHAVETWS